MQEPKVVPARPVLHDLAIHDTPDVDERPRHFHASRLRPGEQRHRRCSVHTPHSQVVRYEFPLGDDVVVLGFAVTKVMADRLEDLPQSRSTLRPSRVVDHVLGHQVVEDVVVAREASPEERLHYRLRFRHPPIVPDAVRRAVDVPRRGGGRMVPFITSPAAVSRAGGVARS
jgi:hypothetical protein